MDRIYGYSVLLIAFLLPSAFYGFTMAAMATLFICWCIKGDYKNIPSIIKQPQVFLPLAFYLFIAFGLFYTDHLGKTLSGLSTQISFLLFPLIIGTSSIIDKKFVDKSGRMFVLSTSFFILIAICYALLDTVRTGQHTILVGESIYSKFGSFGLTRAFTNWHPTYVAMFVNLSIAILIQQYLVAHNKRRILLLLVVVLFLSISLILLNSLIGIASFILLIIYFLFKAAKLLHFNPRIYLAISLFICAGILYVFYYNPLGIDKIESLKNKDIKITDSQSERNLLTMRMAKWETHLDIFKDHWLSGTSYGDINFTRKEFYIEKGYNDLAHYNYNAHNQYLEVLATFGIVGGLIFLSLLLWPILNKKSHELFFPFLIIVSITFLTESILVRQQGILSFMFFYALFTHPNSKKKYEQV